MTERSKRPTLKQTPDPDAATSVWNGPPQAPQVAQPQLRAISKKTPGVPGGRASDTPERALPAVKLRAMSEVSSGQIHAAVGESARLSRAAARSVGDPGASPARPHRVELDLRDDRVRGRARHLVRRTLIAPSRRRYWLSQ